MSEANYRLGYPDTKHKQLPDGSWVPVVSVDNAGEGSGPDRELVVSMYRCRTAFTGASIGDTITATQVIDVSGASPSTITTIWRNQTTAADLAGAPSAANLELVGSQALTDAQLRASPVPVRSSVPAATSAVILAVQTSTNGTDWAPFGNQACVALDIVNNTGTTIEYRRGGAGAAMQIPADAARMVIAITNANQIEVRRTDVGTTRVTLQAEAFTA